MCLKNKSIPSIRVVLCKRECKENRIFRYRNDSNKRLGRLFNYEGRGGAYFIFEQTPQSDSINTQNFNNDLNENKNENNKDLKKQQLERCSAIP